MKVLHWNQVPAKREAREPCGLVPFAKAVKRGYIRPSIREVKRPGLGNRLMKSSIFDYELSSDRIAQTPT